MLRKLTRPGIGSPLPAGTPRILWAVATCDMMAVAWMLAVGDWLDHTSRIGSVITLGGHHLVVLWLALASFAMLATLAPMTKGFTQTNRLHLTVISIAGAVSVGALAGVLSVVVLVVGSLLLIAVVGRMLLGRR